MIKKISQKDEKYTNGDFCVTQENKNKANVCVYNILKSFDIVINSLKNKYG